MGGCRVGGSDSCAYCGMTRLEHDDGTAADETDGECKAFVEADGVEGEEDENVMADLMMRLANERMTHRQTMAALNVALAELDAERAAK